jgi:hypothetical protein
MLCSAKSGTSKATIGVTTAAAIVTLGLIVFLILRCKRRRRLGVVAPEAEVASSHEVQSPLLRLWKPRKSPFSTTPQPFLSLSSTQNSPFDKRGFHGLAQSPLTPNRNSHGDLEQGVDPFRDPVATENLSDNGGVQETKNTADFQSFGDPFGTDPQRLSLLVQFGELSTEERFRPGKKRRTPCHIYTLSSRPECSSSAPPSYRTHGD